MHPSRNIALTVTAVEEAGKPDYKEADILHFAKAYLKNKDLSEALKSVFEYYIVNDYLA